MADKSAQLDKVLRPGPYPELTIPGLLVGYFLGVVIAVSIGYASLILGFSIEGSELAAILGFGILRGLMRRTSIIENNINQTIASAVNGASSGMMFSVPAIFILSEQSQYQGLDLISFNVYFMVLACIAGGILGVAFIIPLRKQFIDYNRLAFPGGIAVAAILKSPGAGMKKALLLVYAAAVSAALQLVFQITGFHDIPVGEWLHLPSYMNGFWFISLLTVGTGYLAGRGGVYFVVGGYVCYWVLAPILNGMGLIPGPEQLGGQSVPSYLRLTLFRPVGIGMLIGGAITGIVLALPLVVSAIRSMQTAAKLKKGISADEMPIKLLYIAVAGAFLLLFVIAIKSTIEIGPARGGLMAILGTLWIWVAGVILSECIGRTNWSPLSGMTLIGITILIFVAAGVGDRGAIISSIMVGAAMCVAMSQATDLMLDLKTGYLVGAIPKKQQIAQFAGTWLGPIVIMVLIFVLHRAYVLGSDLLPAPQGQALASMVSGILGGDVPIQKYISGAGIGALLSASGIGGLGVLVGLGFYLPFNIVLTYTIGTVLRVTVDAKKGHRFSNEVGVPIAAGLIVGEALVGVGAAIYYVIKGI